MKTLQMCLIILVGLWGFKLYGQTTVVNGGKTMKSFPHQEIIFIPKFGSEEDIISKLKTTTLYQEACDRSNKERLMNKAGNGTFRTKPTLKTGNEQVPSNKVAAPPIIPIVHENFTANNQRLLAPQISPPDGTMAISNAGIIVSADYYTIDYYQANGNNGTPLQVQQTWQTFFAAQFPGLPQNSYFDPMLVYDDVEDRFILVLMTGFTPATSQILICFSRSNNPFANGWNIYSLPGTSPANQNTWFDRPTIAISSHDLFISGNMFDPASNYMGPRILQIQKSDGYNNLIGLTTFPWELGTFTNVAGGNSFQIVPAQYGQDGLIYDNKPGIYLVSTVQNNVNGANTIDWYDITGDVGMGGVQIIAHVVNAAQPYAPADRDALGTLFGTSQLNTGVTLDPGDSRTHYAIFFDNTIHFVFTYNANLGNQFPWSGLSYNRIDVNFNTLTEMNLSEVGTKDYTYPCIASFGQGINDKSVMIGFLRGGANIFPQMCVINVDDNTWGPITVIRTGDGFVNVLGNIDRWGDYTMMQRKHNQHAVWMMGQYGFGNAPNSWGLTNGYNSYVAEIGDALIPVKNEETLPINNMKIYPNPSDNFMYVSTDEGNTEIVNLQILDMIGKVFENISVQNNIEIPINISNLPNGTYLLKIQTNKETKYEKICVYH